MLDKANNSRRDPPGRSRSRGNRGRGGFRTPPRDGARGGGKGNASSRKVTRPKSSTRPANEAFRLAKTKGLCPHHNKGECSFGSKCEKPHECVLCGKKRDHGAVDCSQWNSEKAKKLLGSE